MTLTVLRMTFCGLALALVPEMPAGAAPTICPEHFFNGEAPDRLNPKLAVQVTDLCYSAFAIEHSGVTRGPLWSAEHLTADRIEAARLLLRKGSFHAEQALPPDQRAMLSDYAKSGLDRGHLSPSGDMPTDEAQAQSFSLANVIPQAPRLNRVLWEEIESSVRNLAIQDGDVYVVTGPIFQGDQLQALQGRVLIPTAVFKAIYDPASRRAGAYLANNTDDSGYEAISIAQLTQLTGIDVFPGLSDAAKMRVADLPTPRSRYASREQRQPKPTSWLEALANVLFGGWTR